MSRILNESSFLYRHRVQVLFWMVLFLGILFRVLSVPDIPNGLIQDEASIGYDAWSILHYGIDRNGTALPIHLISWGSGQNALYAYLSMPFIALFGLGALSVRLVSVLLGCLTLPAVYFILKKTTSRRTALIGMALLAISPWHISLSRWGLESNIFPAMFAFGVFFLVKAMHKPGYFIVSSVVFALALYAYGPAYCVIPIFYCGAFYAFAFRKKVDKRLLLISGASFVLVAIPIGLFLLTNQFKLGDISIGPFTAPQLTGQARMDSLLGGGTLSGHIDSFYDNIILQRDWTGWNTIQPYGVFYIISLPFTIIGIMKAWKKRTPATYILSGWAGASLLLFVLMNNTNINRVNIIFIPLILLTAIGVEDVIKQDKRRLLSIALAYYLLFTGFITDYMKLYVEQPNHSFNSGLGEAIEKANSMADEDDTIYVSGEINMPYMFVLFYTKVPPQDFLATRQIKDLDKEFQSVSSFGHYIFNTSALEAPSPGIYIIPARHAEQYGPRADEIYYYDKFIVLGVND